MKTSSNGRKFIEGFEGLILQAYDDHNDHIVEVGQNAVGTLTIGYGHTDAAGPPHVFVGQKINQSEADAVLASDLAAVEIEVNHLVKVPLNQDQFDALVSFQFNLGNLGHTGNSLLAALNSGDYNKAADDMLMYDHAGGVKLAGLTRRRMAERALFLTPQQAVDTRGINTGTLIVAVGATTTIAATVAPQHSPLIFLGVIAASILIGGIVHWIRNRKVAQ